MSEGTWLPLDWRLPWVTACVVGLVAGGWWAFLLILAAEGLGYAMGWSWCERRRPTDA